MNLRSPCLRVVSNVRKLRRFQTEAVYDLFHIEFTFKQHTCTFTPTPLQLLPRLLCLGIQILIADCLNTRLGNYREACRDACLTSVCGILSVTDLPTETSKNRKTNNISTTNPSPMMEFFNATHSDSFAKIDTSQCTLVMVRDSDEYGL